MIELKEADFYENTFFGRMSYKWQQFKKFMQKTMIVVMFGLTCFVIGRASVLHKHNHNEQDINTQHKIPVYNLDYKQIPDDINDGY